MTETIAYFCCVVAFAGFGYKLIQARHTQPRRRMWFLSAFGMCIAGGIMLLTPAMENAVGVEEPVGSLLNLAADLLKIGAMAFAVAFARSLKLGEDKRIGWHAVLSWTVVAAEITLFFLSGSHRVGEHTAAGPGGLGWFVAYNVLFLVYGLISLLTFSLVFARFALHADPGPLRVGLWLLVGGGVSALGWTFWDVDDIYILATTGAVDAGEEPLSAILAALSVGLAGAGATLSVWGPALATPFRLIGLYRTYRRIEPLWAALREAVPGIALDPGPGMPGGVEFALYRRVIEIRDGHLALRPYFDPDLPRVAEAEARKAKIPEARVAATVEAATLAAALAAAGAGRRYAPDDVPATYLDEPDIATEAAWLVEVTRAWRRSAVVGRIRNSRVSSRNSCD
ncbi:MAB_1171c family putative transporter [Amycolatopsis sp. NPDC058340]|uniref:MAB_1171c family putative transporter n=1 Tax=Amycolatopsis sp. NPDC058340 TaxID=3346453 RepID=UPI0036604514